MEQAVASERKLGVILQDQLARIPVSRLLRDRPLPLLIVAANVLSPSRFYR
jgi:hypothetical protein